MKQAVCKISGVAFEISDFEEAFIEKVSPSFNGEKFLFPLPELCPDERLRLRTMQRNEQFLHRMKSDYSGKEILGLYSLGNRKIYTHEEWWETDFDAISLGRDYDFGRSFFEQFYDLDVAVPRVALVQVGNENCPYTTGTGYCRNCHLISCSENSENCVYGKLYQGSRDCMDCDFIYDSELCYGCFSVEKCYNCVEVSYAQNCSDCYFSENLKGCRNCFLCTNLANKEYCFMNMQLSKEEYEKSIAPYLGSFHGAQEARRILWDMRFRRIHKYANIVNSEGCTGDFINNSKNCVDCYDVNDSEDCRFVHVGVEVKDLVDCSNMYLKPELSYQVLGTIGTYNVSFALYVFNSHDVFYSQFCYDSEHLFGCIGLRKKKYCIFNKQYSEAEYFELVPRIIKQMQASGEWGQFFPASSSPFPYNNTVANDYLPLTREEALARGYKWLDEDPKQYQAASYQLPETIAEVPDSIVNEVLACSVTGKNYKILKGELEFLRKIKMPVPRKSPEQRELERLMLRNPRRLYARNCARTGEPLLSPYPPNSPIIIYGERAYLEEVF